MHYKNWPIPNISNVIISDAVTPASEHLESHQNSCQRTNSVCLKAQMSLVWGQQGPESAETKFSTHCSCLTAVNCTRLCFLMVLAPTV